MIPRLRHPKLALSPHQTFQAIPKLIHDIALLGGLSSKFIRVFIWEPEGFVLHAAGLGDGGDDLGPAEDAARDFELARVRGRFGEEGGCYGVFGNT